MIDYLQQLPIHQHQTVQEYHQWLHQSLLNGYLTYCNGSDWSLFPDDGYYYQHLVYHAIQARADEFLEDIISNFNWMTNKIIAHTGLCNLRTDLLNCKYYLRNNRKVSKIF